MILLNDATSPFGRKALVCAHERGVALEECFVNLADAEPLARHNPLRQIPALVRDDGSSLYDSDVIALYLDSCHSGLPLLPEADRFERLTRTHLANGLMEAVLQRVMETRRPDGERSESVVAHLEGRIHRVLDHLRDLPPLPAGEALCLDEITLACALAYVDFRYRTDWRADRPQLDAWLTPVLERPAFQVSAPQRSLPASVPAG